MDFSTTIDIIIKDLREIGAIVDDFKKYPDVPGLQIELVKSKCRYAEEIISLLKTYGPVDAMEMIPEEATLRPGKAGSEKLIELTDEGSFAEENGPETDPVKEVAEPVNNKKETGDISSVIRSIPLSDLSGAIRLNERFLFIREIFDGNITAYEEAVTKLNRAESVADAKAIIMSYTGDAEETEVVSQLLEIVKRKMPSNG